MGYWFVAPGAASSQGKNPVTVQAGGGGEIAIRYGVSVGFEGSALGLKRDYTGTVAAVGSANAYYHFFHAKDARFDPFVTGGYSALIRNGTHSLGNYGAGLNYWFSRHMALRTEVRDQVYTTGPTIHYWGVRIGMSFTEFQP
jgi:hypothetical protein